MVLFRILPAMIVSLLVTLATLPARADVAHDAKPTPRPTEPAGGVAAVYFEKVSETVYVATRDDRRELMADIASGEVRKELEEAASDFLSEGWEHPEFLPDEDYEFQLLDIVDVSGWVAVATYRNKKGEVLNAWVSGVESPEEAIRALDKHAASKGFPKRVNGEGAYIECDACRVP